MTDRLNGCVVVFEKDIRVDDAEAILDAIRMVKGVLAVKADDGIVELGDYVAQERTRRELGAKLWEILYPKEKA